MENKTGKYLKYAMGEIILVVFGILIALQINTWNQNRMDSKVEARLLQAIVQKMEFNVFQHNRGSSRYRAVIEAAQELLIAANDSSFNPSKNKIEQHLSTLTKRFLMGKSNETSIYDEMIGSGQLILLKSEKLRSELTALKANMQLLAAYEEAQNRFVDNQLSPYLNEHINRLQVNQNAKSDLYDHMLDLKFADLHLDSFSDNKVLSERQFSNLLVELITHSKTLLPIYDRIRQNITLINSIAASGYSISNKTY